MPQISTDAPTDVETLAAQLSISTEAVQLCRGSEFVDLHLDTFIPVRLFGYDITRAHDDVVLGGRFFGHLDLPRMNDAGITGAMWSITTNPWRTRRGRSATFQKNLARLDALLSSTPGVQVVTSARAHRQATAQGEHAAQIVIQGGNALSPEDGYAHAIADDKVTAVTLVHLTHSFIGRSSAPAPLFGKEALTDAGRDLVRSLNEKRIFVDLAHIHPEGFWEAVKVHDKSQPLIDTHTGVCGVRPHWRNLDDDQLRAIADTGGVIGVIFEPGFIRPPGRPNDANLIVDHMDHIIQTVGEDHVAIGTDYDGAIIPPPQLRSGRALPIVVQRMLDRGYSPARIEKILGENFLRSWAALRG